MKRPPEVLLLSAVILGVIFQNIDALRGTQLIFRKTTSTSTTEAIPEADRRKDEVAEVTEISETTEPTTPKSNLTGIPQLDYIYDPNLPRELNGYNLSSYPFYNGMPDNITFKCDGLHDGFYASVDHKCQVYHQCLFSTRFDFLCANYTAFDQKTFICHFVSEVDCINSPKFFSRNDALYKAATTTTLKPTPIVISPALTAVPRKPHTGLRRPKPTRRRPQYDEYDEEYDDDSKEEYYEEPPRRRRKRPRPRRPRPIYDDEYDDYEDERYERRSSGRNKDDNYRKSHDRIPLDSEENSRNKDVVEETRSNGDRRKPNDHKNRDEEPAYIDKEDDRRYDSRDERRSYDKNYRNNNNKYPDNSKSENRNVEGSRVDDPRVDDRRVDDRRTGDDRRNDDRRNDDRRNDDRRNDDRRNDDRRNDDRRTDDRRNDDRKTDDRRNDDRRTDDRRNDDRRTDDRRPDDRRPDDRRPDDRRVKGDGRRGDDSRVDEHRINKHKSGERRPDYDERDEDSYRFDRDRRKGDGRRRRPFNDEVLDDERPRNKPSNSNRDYNDRRPLETASSYDNPRKFNRNQYEDDLLENDDKDERRSFDRPRKVKNKDNNDKDIENKPKPDPKLPLEKEETVLVKPNSSSSVFNQPRAPPRIKPPVPKNEQSKYAYKTSTEKPIVKAIEKDEEYYDDYEDEPNLTTKFKENEKKVQAPTIEEDEIIETKKIIEPIYSRPKVQTFKPLTTEAPIDYIESKPRTRRPSTKPSYDYRESLASNNQNRPRLPVDEKTVEPVTRPKNNYFNRNPNSNQYSTKNLKNEIEVSSTSALPPRDNEPVVKIVKRPFLPSRGGNPYAPRGLQPVGSRSLNNPTSSPLPDDISISKSNVNINDEDIKVKPTNENVDSYSQLELNPIQNNKQTSQLRKAPELNPENQREETIPVNTQNIQQNRFSRPIENEQLEEVRPISNRPEAVPSQQPDFDDYDINEREKSNNQEKNPLDIINEDEYDVTLNDALSPTLPNLPLRNFRSPYAVSTDYTYRNFQRPGYNVVPNQPIDNSYQVRSSSQRVESVAKPIIVEDARRRYTNQYRTQNENVYQNQNFRPHSQITQAQTHAFYPVY